MNWEALGSIGELVSAAGVIATLIYLSVQIRANTTESRLTSSSELAREYGAWLRYLAAEPERTDLWVRAVDDFDALTANEQARVVMITGNFMRLLESAFIQHHAGRMDQISWEANSRLMRRGVSASMFRTYWTMRRDVHSDAFARWVDGLLDAPEGRGLFDFDDAPPCIYQ